MSSLIRRLEIRILKRKEFVRQTRKVVVDPMTKVPSIVAVKHGNIIRPDGTDTGSPFWPTNPKSPPTFNPNDKARNARLARDVLWGRVDTQPELEMAA